MARITLIKKYTNCKHIKCDLEQDLRPKMSLEPILGQPKLDLYSLDLSGATRWPGIL